MTSSMALAQSLPLLARLAGYSALHAKAEEFDLGRSPHCLNPMFACIRSSYRLTTLFLLNPSCALYPFEPLTPYPFVQLCVNPPCCLPYAVPCLQNNSHHNQVPFDPALHLVAVA